MIVYTDFEQGSEAWINMHIGIPTASEFNKLLSPAKLEIKESGKAMKSYVARKLAEWWRNTPSPDFGTFAMETGILREPRAIGKFEMETGLKVRRVGFVTTDNKAYGCSPDGLIDGAEAGIEIKCPGAKHHVKYLLAGGVPPEYRPQVFGSLYVTGLPQWWFMSFCPGFPSLIVTVEPDDQKSEALKQALEEFSLQFEEGKRHLIDLNGGPPVRQTQPEPAKDRPRFTWEMNNDSVTP